MNDVETTSTSLSWRVAAGIAVALLLAGLLLRAWALGGAEYTTDEELSTGLAQLGYGDLFGNLAGRPPLAFLAQKVVVDMTGSVSPAVLRIPSVVEGVLGLLALLLLVGRRVSLRAGLVAMALLALAHFHVDLSRDARYYPLLFLFCTLAVDAYLGFFVHGRWLALPGFLLALAGACMTHYSAFLLLGTLGLMAPVCLSLPVWRARIRQHPKGGGVVAGGVLLCGLVVLVVLWPYLRVPLGHLEWPRADRKLSPLFDISPRFLYEQFAGVLGVQGIIAVSATVLIGAGAVLRLRARIAESLVLAGVLFFPFLILYLFPFDHWWTPKYFVYMLVPLYFFAAAGIDGVAEVAGLLPAGMRRYAVPVVVVALVALIAAPNFAAIVDLYRFPLNPHREAGADLTAWSRPGETVYMSWRERKRAMRHDYSAETQGTQVAVLSTEDPFPYVLSEVPHRWYLATGKVEVHPPFAALMLSERFSRVPYHEFFVATGPNPQRVDFGETFPGYPRPEDSLTLPPGAAAALDMLVPRAGERAVFVEGVGDASPGGIRLSHGDAALTAAVGAAPYTRLGVLDLPRGRERFQLANTRTDGPVTITALELVPTLGDGDITIPAWDFYAMDGGESLATVWPEQVKGGTQLRDLRRGHTAYYRFEVQRTCSLVVRLFALSDPPGSNDYRLELLGAGTGPVTLAFDGEDGEVSYRDTTVWQVGAGVHTLAVTYVGVPVEEVRRATDNYRIMTRQRLQTPGLARIQIYNVADS